MHRSAQNKSVFDVVIEHRTVEGRHSFSGVQRCVVWNHLEFVRFACDLKGTHIFCGQFNAPVDADAKGGGRP